MEKETTRCNPREWEWRKGGQERKRKERDGVRNVVNKKQWLHKTQHHATNAHKLLDGYTWIQPR